MKTRVVHFKKEPFDVYIGRPSEWGNPYSLDLDGDRKQVIELYRIHLLESPELMAKLPTLRGKTLGCWCKPKACHGDVLAEMCENLPNDDFI